MLSASRRLCFLFCWANRSNLQKPAVTSTYLPQCPCFPRDTCIWTHWAGSRACLSSLLLKGIVPAASPVSYIIRSSLCTGLFPPTCKHALGEKKKKGKPPSTTFPCSSCIICFVVESKFFKSCIFLLSLLIFHSFFNSLQSYLTARCPPHCQT